MLPSLAQLIEGCACGGEGGGLMLSSMSSQFRHVWHRLLPLVSKSFDSFVRCKVGKVLHGRFRMIFLSSIHGVQMKTE